MITPTRLYARELLHTCKKVLEPGHLMMIPNLENNSHPLLGQYSTHFGKKSQVYFHNFILLDSINHTIIILDLIAPLLSIYPLKTAVIGFGFSQMCVLEKHFSAREQFNKFYSNKTPDSDRAFLLQGPKKG